MKTASKRAKIVFTLGLPVLAASTLGGVGSSAGATAREPEIVDRLMDCCHGVRPAGAVVDTVVLHFSSDVVRNPADPHDVDRVIAIYEEYRVSAHYLIDRGGRAHRLVKETDRAHHAGKGELPWAPGTKDKLNETSIGIELLAIGTRDEMKPYISGEAYDQLSKNDIGYTDAQYDALRSLLTDIAARHPAIKMDREHIVGHDEYAPGRRTDPGALLDWARIGLAKER